MRITDASGEEHTVVIADSVLLDGHVVAALTQEGDAFVLDKYHIPRAVQGKGVGSQLLANIEAHCGALGAREIRVHIAEEDCPIYGGFFTKHGYVQNGSVWSKEVRV